MPGSTGSASAATDTADRELVFTRVFDAPRELVFEAWTDPKHVARWWGPNGFTTTIQEMDVRPGGVWRHVMRGPDGRDYLNKIIFLEVVRPERLVFKHEPEKGSEPVTHQTTVTFAEEGSKTSVTMRMLFPSAKAREYVVTTYGAIEGAKQTLGRLAEHLPKMRVNGRQAEHPDFVITRVFDAPRERVWNAFTDADHLKHWWGPKGFTMQTIKLDLRPGGVFHYSMRSPDGRETWGKFVYREIVPPDGMVFVNSFSDETGNLVRHPFSSTWPLEVLNTLTLAQHDDQTRLTLAGGPINASEEERETFAAGHASMQKGFGGTFDQLAEYLAKG